MPKTITKTSIEFDEVRISRRPRINDEGQRVVETFVTVGYRVLTDDPESDYTRNFEVGPLDGQNLTIADNIFTRVQAAIENREGL